MDIKEFAKKSLRNKKKSEASDEKSDSKSVVNSAKTPASSSKYVPPGSGTDPSEISNVSEASNAG